MAANGAVTSARPYADEMLIIHKVFRREVDLLPQIIRTVPDGDTARAAYVADAVQNYVGGLHSHHSLEDQLVWPLLHERAETDDAVVTRMESQHKLIDGTLEVVVELLPDWRKDADPGVGLKIAEVLEEHRAVLVEHLDDEEAYVVPLIAEHLTVEEWDAVGERGLAETPKNRLLLVLGAILEDATPAERKHFLGKVPAVGRLMWAVVGRRQYARECRKLRGSLGGR
ncbi:hemerythrin domain-containing protein [Catenulispora rubra]|uniref:hemerythrin domain-containing protein n=1 Tax=Catenulispora rubra TaxID=280293 RepID=UPI001E5364E5|nr:hemerythrin domain-containing protein [Catenulispora rubra]